MLSYFIAVVSKTSGDGEGQVHPLVTCDGCEGKVVESRFKCSVCPDYDLCSCCEGKGLHAHHQLLRIRNPGPPSFNHPCPPWFMPWVHGRGMGPRGGWGGPRGGWGVPRGGWCGPRGGRQGGGPFNRGGRGGKGCPRFPGGTGPGPNQSQSDTSEEGAAFFHQFGETLNSFLRPFGVDVHTYVDDNQGNANFSYDVCYVKFVC